MNRAAKEALINFQASPIHLRTALFHSTPVLDRRRRTYWDSGGGAYRDPPKRFNQYSKRFRKLHAKQTLLRNVSAFADHLFQSWQYDHDEHDPSSSQGSGWFRREYRAKGPKGGWTGNKGAQSRYRRGFQFCEDEVEVETIFQSAFGGHFYWSFVDDEFPQWRSSSDHSSNYRTSRKWRHEDSDDSSDTDCSEADSASDRLALGLRAYGPLTMGDVKNAYRACALKWHPDRHQGSSKAIAEAKFKVCSAAYQSLCDKLALN